MRLAVGTLPDPVIERLHALEEKIQVYGGAIYSQP